MGSSSVWIAMSSKNYEHLRKEYPDYELVRETDQDGLYSVLESYGLGGGFVYDELFDSEWEAVPEYSWFSHDMEHLKVEKLETGDVRIWFPSAKDKRLWFSPYFDVFRMTIVKELGKAKIKTFSSYELCDPAWRLKEVYSNCWDGRVMSFDAEGRMGDFETPMNFLRTLPPREKWVIAGKEWRYK